MASPRWLRHCLVTGACWCAWTYISVSAWTDGETQHQPNGTNVMGKYGNWFDDSNFNNTSEKHNLEEYWFVNKLLHNYDKRAHPTFSQPGVPTVVTVDIYIRSFGSINAVDMEFSVDVYMRQSWRDPRLNQTFYPHDFRVTDPEVVRQFWRPDTYFPDAKKSTFHDVTTHNWGMIINPNGTVLFSTRLTMTFSCSMNLRSFPFDVQLCYIELGTYWYTTDQIVMRWKDSVPVKTHPGMRLPQFEVDKVLARAAKGDYASDMVQDSEMMYQWTPSGEPVTWYDRISVPQFHVKKPTKTRSSLHKLVAGAYSVLIAEIVLERQYGYHLVQTYLPSIMIVTISWVSSWLDVDAIPARTTLGVTTLLTITTQSAGVRSTLPPVSYAKAIDIWLGTCTFFVFASLLEFTCVNYTSRKTPRRIEGRKATLKASNNHAKATPTSPPAHAATDDTWIDIELNADTMRPKTGDNLSANQQAYIRKFVMENQRIARRMDRHARIFMPLSFIAFNAFYWPYYLAVREPIE